ncbi:MAG: arylsulfatase [Bacteroidaceae bacterium]
MKKHTLIYIAASLPIVLSATNKNKPNIVFILCDDMGYGDLACYGQKYIKTPNIDNLAKEGMRFTQAYSGSPVSAPSRASLMTGQHSGHCEIRGNKEYWSGKMQYGNNTDFAITGQHPLDPDHIVLPEIMKDCGYTTAQFGKWAGGYEGSVSTPDKRGIDEFYGYICQFQAHLYYPNFLNRYSKMAGDTCVVRETLSQNTMFPMYGDDYFKRQQYSADIIHQKALEWIERQNEDQPFYALLTYTLPHAELAQPHDSILKYYQDYFVEDKTFKGSRGSRYNAVNHTHAQFAAMITRLDTYVGEIITKLKEKGLDENTIIIFSSDNGPHEEGGADPSFFNRDGILRGLKRQTYEGGIRVPFIVKWPGKIKANTLNNLPIAFWDIMPTFCDILGLKNYEKKYSNKNKDADYFDGISFLPSLFRKNKKQKYHDFLYWEFNETNQVAVRQGDWKLISKSGKCHLYNLARDIHEDNDLSSQYPEIVNQLVDIAHKQHTPNQFFHVTMPGQKK